MTGKKKRRRTGISDFLKDKEKERKGEPFKVNNKRLEKEEGKEIGKKQQQDPVSGKAGGKICVRRNKEWFAFFLSFLRIIFSGFVCTHP